MAEALTETRLRELVVEMATMLADLARETDRLATARRAEEVLHAVDGSRPRAPEDHARALDGALAVVVHHSSHLIVHLPADNPIFVAASAINGTASALRTTLIAAAVSAPTYGKPR